MSIIVDFPPLFHALPHVFASSNDDSSMVVWSSQIGTWKDLQQKAVLNYDASYGVANSGDSFNMDGQLYFIVGHANGFVTIWAGNTDGTGLNMLSAVDVRATNPVNPWRLHNVRGVSTISWSNNTGYIITGSEDGDLCIVRVPDGTILSRTIYNPKAQRGINSIATLGQHLLVANCAVGPNDKNLWYYQIDFNNWSILLRDSVNLRVNPAAPQVFNFCVIWGLYEGGACFYSSTEEGTLWMGNVVNKQKLSVFGYQEVTSQLGAALAFEAGGKLALVAYNLYEFTTLNNIATPRVGNPQHLSANL